MTLVDTHCHIHEATYTDAEGAYARAIESGVGKMICVGTDETSSVDAVNFASSHDATWASLGVHPHEAKHGVKSVDKLKDLVKNEKVVAIGECGLDYFYSHSPKDKQVEVLHAQIELAINANLPMIFHVRDAFDDFWPIFDQYQGLKGVLHSFTDDRSNLEKGLERGLFIGVNGISTFSKDKQDMYASIPLPRMLLETDAPFLTPIPYRGKVNEPALLMHVAQYIANLQSINLQELSRVTTASAKHLFQI